MAAFVIVGGLVWLLLTGHDAIGAFFAVLAGVVGWWAEARFWPEVDCWAPWCKNGIVSWSPFTRGARRRHKRCGGSGKRRRALAGSAS